MPEGVAGPLRTAEEIVSGPAPSLTDVRFYKVSAELVEPDEAHGADEDSVSVKDSGGETEVAEISVNIGLRTRQQGGAIGVRVEFAAVHDDWKVFLDVAAEYVAEEPFEATEEGRTDFADKVGIMTLYPYIREAVGNLTQRTVGSSFMLPTIRQGEVSFATESFTPGH